MEKRIFLSSSHMSDEGYELSYIHDAFEKNWVAPLGANVDLFEQKVCAFLGGGNTVALSAGTAALHLGLLLAGVKRGDKVFCQDLTFSASANPITYLGAEPVFIDSERETWNIDPKALKKAFELYGAPKAVVVVHLYGAPAQMDEISALCKEHNVPIIEDAAEALGSEYRGKKCGLFGSFGVLSFNGNKIITTSGGGMLICEKKEDAVRALKLATQAREPMPYYWHTEIGYNYRLSNISAGIGCGQMQVLPLRVSQKQAIFEAYKAKLANLPLEFQPLAESSVSNRWLSSVLIKKGCPVTPKQIIEALADNNIEARHLWKPMHSQPVFADAKYVTVDAVSVSDDLFERGVCLPSDTKMSMSDVDRICKIIRSVFEK